MAILTDVIIRTKISGDLEISDLFPLGVYWFLACLPLAMKQTTPGLTKTKYRQGPNNHGLQSLIKIHEIIVDKCKVIWEVYRSCENCNKSTLWQIRTLKNVKMKSTERKFWPIMTVISGKIRCLNVTLAKKDCSNRTPTWVHKWPLLLGNLSLCLGHIFWSISFKSVVNCPSSNS